MIDVASIAPNPTTVSLDEGWLALGQIFASKPIAPNPQRLDAFITTVGF